MDARIKFTRDEVSALFPKQLPRPKDLRAAVTSAVLGQAESQEEVAF